MNPEKPNLFIEKAAFLKQFGYALIAVGLIFLTFLSMTPELHAPLFGFYSCVLVAVGAILAFLYKGLEIIQHSRLKKRSAYCLECGWFGRGDQWYRYECCPECDSERIALQ